ncbi:MAG TPA: hypothetical protein VGN97_20595 [Mesorhizobium sp.]|jgi:hypothetical protein|nr:hypothetical protein [Mesorhizobium sp.]
MRRACAPGLSTSFRRAWLGAAAGFWAIASAASAQEPPPPKFWFAGPYSFSDELGGFRITGAEGFGIKDEPVVLTQELQSASPVTLVIRAVGPIRPFARPGSWANGILHLRLVVRNASGLGWVEFELELQELLGEPSVFGDGLSFDQRQADGENILSSNFASYNRDFEPYDRLLFQEGKVDPLGTAEFGFLVTDFTPRRTFYLVLDPRIPSS